MSTKPDDPLTHALATLQYLRAPKTDPVSLAYWEEVQDALLEAQREREALLAVATGARELVDAIDEYEGAAETAEAGRLDRLGEVCIEAETALAVALNHLHAVQDGSTEDPSTDH